MPLYIKRKNKKKPRSIGTAHQDIISKIQSIGADPLEGLAYFATGNVVALGFMSEDEFNKPTIYAEVDGEEVIQQTGGDLKALKLISPKMRFAAVRELAGYIYPKRAPAVIDEKGNNIPQVMLYLPENDRDKKP